MCWGSSCSLKLNLNKLCNSQKFSLEKKIFLSLSETLKKFLKLFLLLYHFCASFVVTIWKFIYFLLYSVYLYSLFMCFPLRKINEIIFFVLCYHVCAEIMALCCYFSRCCCRCCCCCCIFNGFILWMRKKDMKIQIVLFLCMAIAWSAFIVPGLLKHQSWWCKYWIKVFMLMKCIIGPSFMLC